MHVSLLLPDPTAPNVGGVPHSHSFFHPHFSNHATVAPMSETFNIGVKPLASITEKGYHRMVRAAFTPRRELSRAGRAKYSFQLSGSAADFKARRSTAKS